MDPTVQTIIEECAHASHAGTASFGDLVARLAAAGVESYHADYRAGTTRYYLPDGRSHAVALPTGDAPVADRFDPAALVEAIRGSQRGAVKYPEFVARSLAAGTCGYIVWIAGRHVSYFGRRGEVHVEHFPS